MSLAMWCLVCASDILFEFTPHFRKETEIRERPDLYTATPTNTATHQVPTEIEGIQLPLGAAHLVDPCLRPEHTRGFK